MSCPAAVKVDDRVDVRTNVPGVTHTPASVKQPAPVGEVYGTPRSGRDGESETMAALTGPVVAAAPKMEVSKRAVQARFDANAIEVLLNLRVMKTPVGKASMRASASR